MRGPVQLLGRDDCEKLLAEYGYIEVTCEFCQETYRFSPEEVETWWEKVA